LYGTTYFGGSTCGAYYPGCGTVFSIDPNTGHEQVVYSFPGVLPRDGALPKASLVDVGGRLYGTTAGGGAYNYGTVFELSKR
jgi:uncharacterized repeat protein (TIGR03803 family)